jgi:starch-binding outer membrane protein SusE/F
MKKFIKSILTVFAAAITIVSCDKTDDLNVSTTGNAVVLSSSATAAAPVAADSNKAAITFSWNSPKYAQDSSLYKFVIQIDSTGRNFTKAYEKIVTGVLSAAVLAKEINTAALAFGFAYNTPYDMDVRVISSYGNNNERYFSNTVKLKYTPYKIPPKVAFPASGKLFIVGDATQGGWNNPVPVPSQEFGVADADNYAAVINMKGSGQYLLLPVNGDWGTKYGNTCGGDGCNNSAGDAFKLGGNNFSSPATAGWYKMLFNFQTGSFKVAPTEQPYSGASPTDLYIVGDATNGGWNNPVPDPAQKFTKVSSTMFKLTLTLTAGKSYLLLPVNGSWNNKFGGSAKDFGSVLADNAVPGSNTPAPDVTGTYQITVDFAHGFYKVTKQ